MPGKQEWGERRNEAGKEVEKNQGDELLNWLLGLVWFLRSRLGRPQCFGTEEGRTMELQAPFRQRFLQELWAPHTSESRLLPPQAAAREATLSAAVALSMHELRRQVNGSQQHSPTVHPQPAASSSAYHLCSNRKAPGKKGWGFKALSKTLLSHAPSSMRDLSKQSITMSWPLSPRQPQISTSLLPRKIETSFLQPRRVLLQCSNAPGWQM